MVESNIQVSDVLSLFAISISCFTFWWTSFRKVEAFYLIRVDKILQSEPEFALINAGSDEILVTSIYCMLKNNDDSSRDIPQQSLKVDDGQSFLIPSGKSIHCKVRFTEPFTSREVLTGLPVRNGSVERFHKPLIVCVEWLNCKGENFSAECHVLEYGFDKSGIITFSRPLEKKHDLFLQHKTRSTSSTKNK